MGTGEMTQGMKRRTFLKVLGVTGAGTGIAGCSTEPVERLLPYVIPPEEITPGVATWYASVCQECSAGCGIWVKTREGRAIKIEGNPYHPVSRGGLCARGHSSIQALYDPDRFTGPKLRENGELRDISWEDAEAMLAQRIQGAAGNVVFITGSNGPSFNALADRFITAVGGTRVEHEALADAPLREAARIAFGSNAVPRFDFEAARFVVSFGADFLDTWLSPVEHMRGFARASVMKEGGQKTPMVFVGPRLSLTGQNADEWLPIRPGSEAVVALSMAALIARGAGNAGPYATVLDAYTPEMAAEAAGIEATVIAELAQRFVTTGPSLALGPGVAGLHRNATATNLAVLILNSVAGNLGRTVHLQSASGHAARPYAELEAAIRAMAAGGVGVAMVHGANPAYTLPPASGFVDAFGRVGFKVSFASSPDETAALADLILPDRHYLEAWGDSSPRPGVYTIQQPVMQPVPMFETKQTGDVLASVAGRMGSDVGAPTFYDHLRAQWQTLHGGGARVNMAPLPGAAEPVEAAAETPAGAEAPAAAGAPAIEPAVPPPARPAQAAATDFPTFWKGALARGIVDAPVGAVVTTAAGATAAQPGQALRAPDTALTYEAPALDGEGLEFTLVVHPSGRFGDGARTGNRPWLLELPDPVSKITWHSWVELHPDAATRLDLRNGDVVTVRSPHGELQAPVWIYPGIHPEVVSLTMGLGHQSTGRFGDGNGVNPMILLPAVAEQPSGGLVHLATRVSIEPTGVRMRPATIAGSDDQHDRPIAMAISLEELETAATAAEEEHEPLRELNEGGGFVPVPTDGLAEDFPLPGSRYGQYGGGDATPRWAMAVDLDKCTGCSACVVACQAENNVPWVGEEQVRMGRDMAWIRLDRFYETVDAHAAGPVDVRHLPMLCQHCNNAPCEPVCPVFAAYHTPEGMNAQVYNRCVGTRYCANNCPYKVRVFNWYTFTNVAEPLNWAYNPDVTVRENGVMEKCTFCVQRVREAQNRAALEGGRPIVDGEIVPACQQSCPAEAIVFGNIKDPASRVAELAHSERTYRVLDELINTQPGVHYLRKVTFHHVEAGGH